MNTLLLLIPLFCTFFNPAPHQPRPDGNCKTQYDTQLKKEIYEYADEMPEFPGGLSKMMQLIMKNTRNVYANYTSDSEAQIQSRVVFSFVVEVDGSVLHEEIPKKTIDKYTPLEKEVLKAVRMMPKWKAGSCNNKKVPVRMIMPMTICYQM